MATRIPNTASETEVRQAFAKIIDGTDAVLSGGASGSVLVGSGVGSSPSWTTSLTALTLLTVDNVTINGAAITSSSGAISFDDENISTSGTISGVNVTSGADPGHTHDARYFAETEHLNVSAGAVDAGKPIKLNASGVVDSTMISAGGIDHGGLGGLSDDDHSQYHNDTRGDARYYTEAELDAGQLDNRYFRENEHISTSAGVADAGKPIVLNASGIIDSTMITSGSIDHGGTTGLGDDDHTQYFRTDGTRTMTGVINAGSYGLITTGPVSSGAIVATKTWTSYVASDAYAIKATAILDTGWITGWNYGFWGQGTIGGSVGDVTMQVMGGIGRGQYQSSGTLGWLIGLKGDCYIWTASASGTIQKAASYYAQYFAYGGGATAVIDAAYGLYIDARGVGTARYAIYVAGDQSYFGGKVGIGVVPTSMLDITLSEAGTAARQDCVTTTYTNTGTNSYNSIGRGVQGIYMSLSCSIATNYNGIYILPQTANSAASNIGTLCAIQLYTGYGYNASATVGTAIGVYIKGWGNTAPGTFTAHYGIKIDAISGAASNYAIHTAGGHVVFNENGTASITRIEGDTDANLLYVDGVNDRVAVGTATPTAKFTVYIATQAGTASQQGLIDTYYLQTGSNTFNTNGRGIQCLDVDIISHGATNLNGIYVKPRGDNNFTIGTACGIQLYSFFGEDGAGCSLTTAIGVYIKGLGGTTPATFTNHYGLKINRITGAATLNYAIHTTGGNIVFNEGGYGDSDVRMESDLDANCFFLDASANNICIGSDDPAVRLDIVNAAGYSGLRIRTARTPTSASAAGAAGEICWDATDWYVCSATNTWVKCQMYTWYSDCSQGFRTGRVVTTNATPTTLTSVPMIDQDCFSLVINIVARRTDANDECAAYRFEVVADRNGATSALVGSVTKTVIAEDTAAWDADVTVDDASDSIVITVTGELAKTILWFARIEYAGVNG